MDLLRLFLVIFMSILTLNINVSGFQNKGSNSIGLLTHTPKTWEMKRESRFPSVVSFRDVLNEFRATSTNVHTTAIEMPSLSSTMKEGKIVSWKKSVGDKIEYGDTLMVVESDKADMDVESFYEGYLAKQLVTEGESAAVGQAVGLVVNKLSDVNQASLDSPKSTTNEVTHTHTPPKQVEQPTNTAKQATHTSKPSISSTPIYMPSLSSTMSEGKIIKWLKNKGDKIELGDSIMIVESDKADMEVEAFEEGYLATILTAEGEFAKVNNEVAYLVANKDDISKFEQQLSEITNGQPTDNTVESSNDVPKTPVEMAMKMPTSQPKEATHTQSAPVTQYKSWLQNYTPSSVDQSIYDQIPPSQNNERLSDIFMERVENLELGTKLIKQLKETKEGQEQLSLMKNRATNRIPTPNNLYANDQARQGSLWKISGAARVAMDKYGLDEFQVEGSGMGGRIFVEDVERAAENMNQQSQTTTISVTPSARNLAKSKGVDPQTIPGTGPYGRITLEDVQTYLKLPVKKTHTQPISTHTQPISTHTTTITQTPTIEPLVGMKKAISKNMEATLNIPVFRVTSSISTDNLDTIYRQLKSKGVSLSSLIIKAVANTLTKHPIMNAAYSSQNGGSIVHPNQINIASAVALEDGLITPVIKNANTKGLLTISSEWKELVEKAKTKRLTAEDYAGGTFVISNLGMYGVTQFDAILPTNVGTIMAISASLPKCVQTEDGEITQTNEMCVTVTCDHRHIYGSHAAEFLRDLKSLIEDTPMSLLL